MNSFFVSFFKFVRSIDVRNGIISKDQARLYNDLFERRQEADYSDFVYFEESEILPLLPQVRDLLDLISKILTQN